MRNGYTVTYQMRKQKRQRREKIIGYILKFAAVILAAFLIVRFVCFSFTIQGDFYDANIRKRGEAFGESADLPDQRTEPL